MNVRFKLVPEGVFTAQAEGKDAILALLADRFAEIYGLDRAAVLDGLEERERLGSTGFGRGVAIPHARIDGIDRPVSVLLRLEDAVDYSSADGMPVDLVFGLLSPTNAGVMHLHALAAVSRMLRDEDTHRALSEAPDGESLFALLTNATDRNAA